MLESLAVTKAPPKFPTHGVVEKLNVDNEADLSRINNITVTGFEPENLSFCAKDQREATRNLRPTRREIYVLQTDKLESLS